MANLRTWLLVSLAASAASMLYVSADVSNGLGAKHSHSAVAPSRQLPAVPPSNGTFMQPTNTTGSNSGNASSPTQPSQSTIRSDPICVCAREGLTDTCTAAKDQYCATAGANNDFCLEYVPLLQTKSWEAALEVATFLDKACHIAQTGSHSEVDLCSCFKVGSACFLGYGMTTSGHACGSTVTSST